MEAVFRVLDEPIPPSFEETVVLTHQREGAMMVIDQLIQWIPEPVRDARAKAAIEGKEDEDNDQG